nr:SpvB/TcaC N-terminal domain-containing protein [Pseudomonas sp. P42]
MLIYGKTPASRRASADPDNPLRISAWLLCESMNPHGEHIAYVYKADDQSPDSVIDYGIQRYLERVCYGNFTASKDLYAWTVDNLADLDWHFQLLCDYGERTTSLIEVPAYDGATLQPWPGRADPFSTYGRGFEVRTRRLCRQMLMFHHFPPSQGDQPVLVRRLLLEHSDATPHWPLSQISAAHYQAFDASGTVENTPAVEFEYSAFEINQPPTRLFETDHQPGIEDGRFYQCVDLYGEGVPGFLCRYDKCWYYREPLRAEAGGAGFRMLEATGKFANYLTLNAFPLEFFHTLSTLGDLSGDGLNSIAMIGPKSVRLYANRREQGFAPAEEVG